MHMLGNLVDSYCLRLALHYLQVPPRPDGIFPLGVSVHDTLGLREEIASAVCVASLDVDAVPSFARVVIHVTRRELLT